MNISVISAHRNFRVFYNAKEDPLYRQELGRDLGKTLAEHLH